MGIPTLITTNTSSNASSSAFTSSIDSTYDEYMFVCTDINPSTDVAHFQCQFSTDGGSNYGMTVTSTTFYAQHYEDDSSTSLAYQASADLAQSTSDVFLNRSIGNGADESTVAILHLFNPSNTTYVKNFYARSNEYAADNSTLDRFTAGYINDTQNVDAVIFRMSSGNFDGVIQMYGIA